MICSFVIIAPPLSFRPIIPSLSKKGHEIISPLQAVLADPQMPVTSTLLDQAHDTIERQLFAMKGFHHPDSSQQHFWRGS